MIPWIWKWSSFHKTFILRRYYPILGEPHFAHNRIFETMQTSKLSHAFKLALHKFMHTDGPQSIIQITCLSEKKISPGNDFKWGTLSFKTFWDSEPQV